MDRTLLNAMDTLSNLQEAKVLAKYMAETISKDLMNYFSGYYFTVLTGLITTLISAIVYMYFAQKAERKRVEEQNEKTNDRLYAVLQESIKLMETVKIGLKTSEECEAKTEKTLGRMLNIVRGCALRDKTLDKNELDEES